MQNNEENSRFQIYITNMKWGRDTFGAGFKSKYASKRNLPDSMAFDVPESITSKSMSDTQLKNDVETYTYNTLSRKYGKELEFAQLWLPLTTAK